MSSTPVDVLIVGAGPTGLALACELVRQGVKSFRIIDRLQVQLKQTKASVLWPRSLELLANYENVLDDVYKHCEYVRQFKYATRSGIFSSVQIGAHFASRYNHGALLEQWYTEKALTTYLSKHGICIERGIDMTAYKYDANGDILASLKSDTNESSVVAKYLIGCDGARSYVHKAMNCAFEGCVLPFAYVAVHFTSSTIIPIHEDEMRLNMFDDGSSFITPMPKVNNQKSYLTAIDLTNEQDAQYCDNLNIDRYGMPTQLELTPSQVEDLISKRVCPCKIESIVWKTHFRVNERLAAKYSDGKRIFLAGDACHCHTPLGGQGMNTGIQDAINLGWKLALALRDIADFSLLESYPLERRLVGQELIAFTTRAQNMASTRSPLIQLLRNRAVSMLTSIDFIVDSIASVIGETIVAYQSSPLTAEHWGKPSMIPHVLYRRRQNILRMISSRVHAGGRAPLLENIPPNFFTETTGFKVIYFCGKPNQTISPKTPKELTELGSTLVKVTKGSVSAFVIVDSSQTKNHDTYGVQAQCMFLIRPDGYVALRVEPVEKNDVVLQYLGERLHFHQFQGYGAFRPEAFDIVPYLLYATLITSTIAVILMHGKH